MWPRSLIQQSATNELDDPAVLQTYCACALDSHLKEAEMSTVGGLRERVAAPVEKQQELSESHLWDQEGKSLIWQAKRFVGRPHFYPVYRWGEHYSWSLAALILYKGRLVLNRHAAEAAASPRFLYYPGVDTIDAEIERIGGPPALMDEPHIASTEELVVAWVEALQADVAERELRHPGCTNVILAGGKDSMNLLLLPWRNPTLVVSAAPNFQLVRRFVANNDLDIEVRELCDFRNEDVLEGEILGNGCRADLRHYRWGAHLTELADEFGGRALFWKGQLADVVTTPYWKTFTNPPSGPRNLARKVYARMDCWLPQGVQTAVADRWLVPGLLEALWKRGAMFQGTHMGVLRGLTGCLFVSAYHGPRVSSVWRGVRYVDAVQSDIRPRIGALLRGGPVHYPAENPAPPPSAFRAGLCQPQHFLRAVRSLGVEVVEPDG